MKQPMKKPTQHWRRHDPRRVTMANCADEIFAVLMAAKWAADARGRPNLPHELHNLSLEIKTLEARLGGDAQIMLDRPNSLMYIQFQTVRRNLE